jgi:hypothetical protein
MSLLSRIMRKPLMFQRLNLCNRLRLTQYHWHCQLKKTFTNPTPWIFVMRRITSPVCWTSSQTMSHKLTRHRQSHTVRKRQIHFKRKLKDLFPQKMHRPPKWRPPNQRAKDLRLSLTVKRSK